MSFVMQLGDWIDLFTHFLMLSLLSVGGAITTTPDIYRFVVTQKHWLTPSQFTSSIAIAQGAPGPNVIFVALMGWSIGLNAAGGHLGTGNALALAALGASLTMLGILLPSSLLTYVATQWAHKNRELRAIKAFKAGMAPMVMALLIATGWLLAASQEHAPAWPLWLTTAVATLLVWRTKIHLLILLGIGAALGGFGFI